MTLLLPDDVPVAVAEVSLLDRYGKVVGIPRTRRSSAVVLVETVDSVACVWCRVEYRRYRDVWERAAQADLVSPLSHWGDHIDVDHVVARSAARHHGLNGWFLRLFPTYADVNRTAGGSRERHAARTGDRLAIMGDVIFANELQVLKMLGHPVGTADEPESIFDE